ncbi:N-formylglutamate amidohydrolase [Pontibacter sp. KCTC 32443]|uniref:N-formylglutamate amidohydrolase n=1 Tax=Pontibacter TaxID=323449 RepID=UPI00164E20EA|nr:MULTISPECIES: N-formylglutamate amidohydrolase [Pontibacter]MBC5773100.1 N-formylglutamate amidohydrolase [Pontibacter sp. KCTC 32443]
MPVTFILSCEHAGNEVPSSYEHLFKGKEEVLYTHKAIDFGALQLAEHLAAELELALYYPSTTRLLVEANRSLENEELFSKYTKSLPSEEKKHILDSYYFPHRQQIEEAVGKEIAVGNRVVHVAVHSFTPAMDGEVRKADIGILFDPERTTEKKLAKKLKTELLYQNHNLKVLYNSPYPGTTDGLPAHLRKIFPDEFYSGFELEVNQRFYLSGNTEVWEKLKNVVSTAFKKAIN